MPDTLSEPKLSSLKLDGQTVRYCVLHPHRRQVVVMVHGFRGDHRGLMAIGAALDGYRVIIPDLPGAGETPPMESEHHDYKGYAIWLRRFIDALGYDSIVLIGHSYGALIAGRAVADSAKGISRLVLINPVSQSRKGLAVIAKYYYRIGLNLPERAGRWLLYSRTVNRLQSFLMMKTISPRLRRQIYQHHLRDLDTPFRRVVIAEAVSSVLQQPVMDYTSGITVPTLIIGGSRDDLAPPAAQRRLQRAVAGSQLDIIPGVGHLTHLEQPAAVARSIRAFLQAPAAPRGERSAADKSPRNARA